jgi:hypothetical protein
MRIVVTLLVAILLFATTATNVVAKAATHAVPGLAPPDFSCSGEVHAEAIDLWEHSVRHYLRNKITNGLNKKGDVYVLYNTQVYLQSFVEMTRRCKDRPQIAEVVDVLSPTFDSLRPLSNAPNTRGWICSGGHTCTASNHLLGKEVQLCSAQFLGLLGAVATSIAEIVPSNQRTAAEKIFLVDAATAMATQVNNWLSSTYFKWVETRSRMTPASAKDGKSAYFFTDKDLWIMTTLSDLAELDQRGIELGGTYKRALKSLQAKHHKIADIFDLFLKRTTIVSAPNGDRAEIDRGYWRNYADSRYAAYDSALSPVQCRKNTLGVMQKTLRVKSKAAYIDPHLGWDLSHARRLVPALDTFVRNRTNLATTFSYHNASFDPLKLQQAYANQIVDKIWNKDSQYPLFSNFWDGSNGWYRAGYENGTGQCRPGDAPYGLAWSFPTGSYPEWGAFNSAIRSLSKQLYTLFNSNDPKAETFVEKHYAMLESPPYPDSSGRRSYSVWTLTFFSSLVRP